MKIGSGTDPNFMKINVRNISEQNENTSEQLQETKVKSEDSDSQGNQISISARPLNMLAGNFVHSDETNDGDNYSLMNLKGFKSNQSLMTKFNSFMVDLVADRLAYTDNLMESGLSPIDAKYAAAAEFEKKGMDAHEKLGDDLNEEELEKQAEEAKKFTEERTEEVVEEKQQEKAEEIKETAEKEEAEIEQKIAERSSESIKDATAAEEVHANAGTAASPSEVRATSSEESASASTDEGPAIQGSGRGENVDEWI